MDTSKAYETQLANIQKRTGKTLDQLVALVAGSSLDKHGQIVAMLKDTLGLGHGDANLVAHYAKGYRGPTADAQAPGASGASGADLDTIYTGPKAALRPIHDAVMARIEALGPFEIAPKKTYLSLRRKKQFATVGPATNTRVEVGLNMKGVAGTTRLEALPPGGMCQYKIRLTDPSHVDDELMGWIRTAYEGAG